MYDNDKHEDEMVVLYRDTVYTPTVELAELRAHAWVQFTPERYDLARRRLYDVATAAAAADLDTTTRRAKPTKGADSEEAPARFPEPAHVVYEYTREHYCYMRSLPKLYEFHVDAFAFDSAGGTGRGKQISAATSSTCVLSVYLLFLTDRFFYFLTWRAKSSGPRDRAA